MTLKIDGYTINELVDLAKKKHNLVIGRQTMIQRIKKNWSIDKAISTPTKRRTDSYAFQGKSYSPAELVNVAKEQFNTQLSAYQITTRINRGWTIERALSTPVRKMTKWNGSGVRESQKRATQRYTKANPEAQSFTNSKLLIREFADEQMLHSIKDAIEKLLNGQLYTEISAQTLPPILRNKKIGYRGTRLVWFFNNYLKNSSKDGLQELLDLTNQQLKERS